MRFHSSLTPSNPEIYDITFISIFKFESFGNYAKNPFENLSSLFYARTSILSSLKVEPYVIYLIAFIEKFNSQRFLNLLSFERSKLVPFKDFSCFTSIQVYFEVNSDRYSSEFSISSSSSYNYYWPLACYFCSLIH